MSDADLPPMDPDTDEADAQQLELAREQGRAYGRAVEHMTGTVATDGGQQRAGDYLIGYAVEQAEGMHAWDGDDLRWQEPGDENVHVEVTVRDAADGRFVPAADVHATVLDADGAKVAEAQLPLLWHPMMYHYGSNLTVPGDGEYRLRVTVEPPRFPRHDEVNGRRFCAPATVEFDGVHIVTGQD